MLELLIFLEKFTGCRRNAASWKPPTYRFTTKDENNVPMTRSSFRDKLQIQIIPSKALKFGVPQGSVMSAVLFTLCASLI